jgi:hypothetical protein
MHAVWPIVVALLTGPSGDRPAVVSLVRVRAAENARVLLDEAAARSATVRALIDRLDATDVIVYLEITAAPQIARARTKLVTATASVRFLRIALRRDVSPFDATPLIAHELQHALEIAERPDVRDDDAVRLLYRRIGHQWGIDRFETDAAGEAERRSRHELTRQTAARIPHP